MRIDKARVLNVINVVITIIGIIVSVVIAVHTYLHRYDEMAEATGEVKVAFDVGDTSACGTFTISAGDVDCGFHQVFGTTRSATQYVVFSKKASAFNYKKYKEIYLTPNESNGDYDFKSSWFSQKYDVKVERKSNKDTYTSFRMDFAVK